MKKQSIIGYYDQNRSVNISKSVTQQHIRYGYQTLDRNMQVISNVPPYNFHDDLKQENVRAAQSQQIKNDQLILSALIEMQPMRLKKRIRL